MREQPEIDLQGQIVQSPIKSLSDGSECIFQKIFGEPSPDDRIIFSESYLFSKQTLRPFIRDLRSFSLRLSKKYFPHKKITKIYISSSLN